MILIFLAVAALVLLFVSIVNFNYQKERYKYATDQELSRLSLFEAPSTWRNCLIISAVFFVITFVLCGKYVMGGFSDMQTQENNMNQSQTDSSNQDANH